MAKILVVDDSIVMRKNLSAILKADGHEIIGEASNGRQAVAQYEELEPDVVTMDISMPIMTGVEAVQRIIERHPEAKIVMISAVNQKKMVFNAINSGAKHYIIKPIETKKVLSVVNEVINTDYSEEEDDPMAIVAETEQGFEINNEDGRCIIRFNKCLDRSDHNLLKMAISGILFIKPLKVEFNFDALDTIQLTVLKPIIELAESIEEHEGQVTYQAQSDAIMGMIRP